MPIIDIKSGKPINGTLTRRTALKGLAGILAAGVAPAITNPALAGSANGGIGYRNLGARLAAISTQGGGSMEKVTAASNMTKQSEVYSWLLGLKNQGYTNCIFVYTGDDRTNSRCLSCSTSASAPNSSINRYYNGGVGIFSISASGSYAVYINSGDEFAVFRY